MEAPQNRKLYGKMKWLFLWPSYIDEKGRILGKTYGIKVRCYWEHHWGTHWEHREHIENLMTKISPPQFRVLLGRRRPFVIVSHIIRLRVGKGQIMCCLSWLSPAGPRISGSLDISSLLVGGVGTIGPSFPLTEILYLSNNMVPLIPTTDVAHFFVKYLFIYLFILFQ